MKSPISQSATISGMKQYPFASDDMGDYFIFSLADSLPNVSRIANPTYLRRPTIVASFNVNIRYNGQSIHQPRKKPISVHYENRAKLNIQRQNKRLGVV